MRRLHVRDRGPGPRDGVVYLGRVHRRRHGGSRRPPATSTLPSDSRAAAVAVARCRSSSRWRSRSRWSGSYTSAPCRHSRPRGPCRLAATWPCSSPNRALTILPGGAPGPAWRGRTPRRPRPASSALGSSPTSTVPSRSNVAGKPPGGGACPRWLTRSLWPGRTARRTSGRHPRRSDRPPRAPCRRGAAPRRGQSGASPSTRSGSRRLPDPRRDRTCGWCRRFARARGRRVGRCRGDRDRPMVQAQAGRRSAAAGGRSPPPTPHRRARAAAASSVMPRPRADRRATPLASRRRSRASTVRSSGSAPSAPSGPRAGDVRARRRRAHACRTSATGIGSSARAVRRCARADFSWVSMVFGLTWSTSATVSTGRSR